MRSVVLLLLCAGMLSAQMPRPTQPPPFTSAPPIEDRELYRAFFVAEQATMAANQAANAANPNAAQQADQQTASRLHVAVQDLPAIADLLQQAVSAYAQIPALRQAFVKDQNPRLTSAQLDGIDDFRRLRITAQTVLSLRQRLSSSSWTGLHNYILNEFKNNQAH